MANFTQHCTSNESGQAFPGDPESTSDNQSEPLSIRTWLHRKTLTPYPEDQLPQRDRQFAARSVPNNSTSSQQRSEQWRTKLREYEGTEWRIDNGWVGE